MPGQPTGDERPLAGELGIPGQRLGDPPVRPRRFAGEQAGGDRFLQQGVAERQAVAFGAQDVRGDRRPQRLLEPLAGHVHDRLEQPVGSRAPDHAGGAHHLLGRRRERLQPRHQQVAHGGRQAFVALLDERQHLFGEERVALGALVHLVEESPVRRHAEDVADLVGLLLAAQRLERDPVVAAADQLGEVAGQARRGGRLVGPQREQQDDVALLLPGQQRQQLAGGRVGPVHVLDHDHQWSPEAEVLQQRGDGLEQPRGAGAVERGYVVDPERRDEPAELRARGAGRLQDRGRAIAAYQLRQQLHDGRVGQHLLALGHAVADDDLHAAGLYPGGELVDDAGLADAGRALDEDGAEPVVGHDLVDERVEPGQVVRAPHEEAAGRAAAADLDRGRHDR